MSNSLTADIRDVLTAAAGSRVLLTAGNTFRSDDGVGPYIAAELTARGRTDVIDAGQWPESVIDGVIARAPERVVVLDAANFGGAPGEARLIPEECVPETTLTTHMIPLNVVTRLITDACGAECHFLGIQGASFALGEGLCESVRATADEIVELLTNNMESD